jgi:hypothetical protein
MSTKCRVYQFPNRRKEPAPPAAHPPEPPEPCAEVLGDFVGGPDGPFERLTVLPLLPSSYNNPFWKLRGDDS